MSGALGDGREEKRCLVRKALSNALEKLESEPVEALRSVLAALPVLRWLAARGLQDHQGN